MKIEKIIFLDNVPGFKLEEKGILYIALKPNVYSYLKEKGIRLIDAPTGKACDIFNERTGRGEKVVGAFHLTC